MGLYPNDYEISLAYELLFQDMQKSDEDGTRYQAFLLRCWRENGQWRFTVEPISQERERIPIANLSVLIAYLQQRLYKLTDRQQ